MKILWQTFNSAWNWCVLIVFIFPSKSILFGWVICIWKTKCLLISLFERKSGRVKLTTAGIKVATGKWWLYIILDWNSGPEKKNIKMSLRILNCRYHKYELYVWFNVNVKFKMDTSSSISSYWYWEAVILIGRFISQPPCIYGHELMLTSRMWA